MRSLILLLVFIGVIAASAWTIYYVNSRNINEPLDTSVAIAVPSATVSPTATPAPTATPSATTAPVVVASIPKAGASLPKAGADLGVLAAAGAVFTLGGAAVVRQQLLHAKIKQAYRR
jgi:hypothetical protein